MKLDTEGFEIDTETDSPLSRNFRIYKTIITAAGAGAFADFGSNLIGASRPTGFASGLLDTSAISKSIFAAASAGTFASLGSNRIAASGRTGIAPVLIDTSALSKQIFAAEGAGALAGLGTNLMNTNALAEFRVNLLGTLALSKLISNTAGISALAVPNHQTRLDAMSGRLASLSLGFGTGREGLSRGFGRLHQTVASDSHLDKAVLGAIESTQSKGAFGFDFNGLNFQASRVSQALEDNPAIEHALAGSLEEVLDMSGLDDETLIDLGESLGWWNRIRTHRVSTAGLVLGFTVGLARFVVAGGAPGQLPLDVFESIAYGGTVYMAIHNSENWASN